MAKKTHGVATLTCRNHPTYRWTNTKYSLPGVPREYIGRGVLMFEGEDGGKPACAFNIGEAALRERGAEFEARFREQYTPECDCPAGCLVFLGWIEEEPPASSEEAAAQIEAIGERIRQDAGFLGGIA